MSTDMEREGNILCVGLAKLLCTTHQHNPYNLLFMEIIPRPTVPVAEWMLKIDD